jgi:hypothetical protein
VDAWEAEWEGIQQDLELYPQNNVQKALLDLLESKLYSRWLNVRKSRMETDGVEYVIIKDELPEEIKACENKLYTYLSELEIRFGLHFLMAFSFFTFPLLFVLSLIFGVPYQPLVYLLFITAITIIYFEPPFERRWEHRLGCYSVPVRACP